MTQLKRDSAEYQRAVQDWAYPHIHACVSYLVSEACKIAFEHKTDLIDEEEALELSSPIIGDDEWIEAAKDNGADFEEIGSEQYEVWHYVENDELSEDAYDDKAEAARAYCEENCIEPDGREIYEHWLIDSTMAWWLEKVGERVVRWQNLLVWCRTTTGQSWSIDWCIERAYDLAHAPLAVADPETLPVR